jgi:hypothetical protein
LRRMIQFRGCVSTWKPPSFDRRLTGSATVSASAEFQRLGSPHKSISNSSQFRPDTDPARPLRLPTGLIHNHGVMCAGVGGARRADDSKAPGETGVVGGAAIHSA